MGRPWNVLAKIKADDGSKWHSRAQGLKLVKHMIDIIADQDGPLTDATSLTDKFGDMEQEYHFAGTDDFGDERDEDAQDNTSDDQYQFTNFSTFLLYTFATIQDEERASALVYTIEKLPNHDTIVDLEGGLRLLTTKGAPATHVFLRDIAETMIRLMDEKPYSATKDDASPTFKFLIAEDRVPGRFDWNEVSKLLMDKSDVFKGTEHKKVFVSKYDSRIYKLLHDKMEAVHAPGGSAVTEAIAVEELAVTKRRRSSS